MAKTALITGGTGQDGSYLIDLLLSKAYVVHAQSRRAPEPDSQKPNVQWHSGNLTDPVFLETLISSIRPDEIYNLAAISRPTLSWTIPNETAQLNAEYWLRHAPDDGIVPWDFDAPESGLLSRAQVDTSASAIAAVGLLNLAELPVSEERREAYRECAMKTIGALASDYLGESVDNWEGILRGGVYHIHKDLGVNESVMWGEFFFVEALQRALRILRSPI